MRGGQLLFVAEHAIDLGHRGEHAGIGLGGTTGHHELRIGPLAARLADRLARLLHRRAGHRAGVEHHGIVDAGSRHRVTNDLRLGEIQPAAEGDDIGAHATPLNNAGSNMPSNSNSTGPVISTWPSLSRQSMARSPPGKVTRTLRPVRFNRAAATAAAQAAEPHAWVRPAPRSQVRMTICSFDWTAHSVMLARCGKIGWFSSIGPN